MFDCALIILIYTPRFFYYHPAVLTLDLNLCAWDEAYLFEPFTLQANLGNRLIVLIVSGIDLHAAFFFESHNSSFY